MISKLAIMAAHEKSTIMVKWRLGCIAALFIGLSGCVTRPSPPVAALAPVALPPRPMPATTLLDLLQAEQLIDAHQAAAALPIYERQAIQTRDPHILERATSLAIVTHHDRRTQTLAQLWLQVDPSSLKAESALAGALWRQGHYEAAGHDLQDILQRAPNTSFEDLVLSQPGQDDQDRQRLLATLNHLVEALPDNPQALYARAFWYAHRGDLQRAQADCERIMGEDPGFLAAYLLDARLLEMQGHLAAAVSTLQSAVKEHPDAYVARQSIAALQLRLGHPLAAEQDYLQLAEDVPADGDFWLAHALLAFQNHHDASARASLERLLSLGEHLNDAHFYLGQLDTHDHHDAAALQHFEAVGIGPDYVAAQQSATDLRVKMGQSAQALQHLQEAATAHPEFASDAAVMSSDILSTEGHYAEAAHLLDLRLHDDPHNPDLLYSRGMLAVELDDLPLFERDIRAVLAQNPDNPIALNALGYTLAEKTNRLDEARGYIEHALRLTPDDAAIIDSLGWVEFRQGHLQQAIAQIQKAWDMSHDDEIGAHLGELLWRQGNVSAARAIWQQSLRSAPGSRFVLETEKRLGAL